MENPSASAGSQRLTDRSTLLSDETLSVCQRYTWQRATVPADLSRFRSFDGIGIAPDGPLPESQTTVSNASSNGDKGVDPSAGRWRNPITCCIPMQNLLRQHMLKINFAAIADRSVAGRQPTAAPTKVLPASRRPHRSAHPDHPRAAAIAYQATYTVPQLVSAAAARHARRAARSRSSTSAQHWLVSSSPSSPRASTKMSPMGA
jgi:hypothetical protein